MNLLLGKGDKVKCFLCDGGLEKWEKSDLPWYLHYKTFPDCLYVRACENQPYIRKIIQQGKIQVIITNILIIIFFI